MLVVMLDCGCYCLLLLDSLKYGVMVVLVVVVAVVVVVEKQKENTKLGGRRRKRCLELVRNEWDLVVMWFEMFWERKNGKNIKNMKKKKRKINDETELVRIIYDKSKQFHFTLLQIFRFLFFFISSRRRRTRRRYKVD